MARSYYDVLGVAPDSDPEVIDVVYRALIKKYHPDRTGRATNQLAREINVAYAVLKDEQKRRAYDVQLKKEQGGGADAIVSTSKASLTSCDRAGDPTSKLCPDCAETVRQNARICRYCGYQFDSELDVRDEGDSAGERQPRRWGEAAIVAIAGLLLLIWALSNPNPRPEELRNLIAASETHSGGAGNSDRSTASISSRSKPAKGGRALVTSIPERVGECTESTIAWIGDRFGETNEASPDVMGTAVRFENGLYVVSYEREEAIWQSQIGDPVHVCLTSIPHGCPPGDQRGREYETTNLRTHERWNLPDSQHMCGGA